MWCAAIYSGLAALPCGWGDFEKKTIKLEISGKIFWKAAWLFAIEKLTGVSLNVCKSEKRAGRAKSCPGRSMSVLWQRYVERWLSGTT